MSLSNSQREDIRALGIKLGLSNEDVEAYIQKHPQNRHNQVKVDMINIRANQLGMSYGKYVALHNI